MGEKSMSPDRLRDEEWGQFKEVDDDNSDSDIESPPGLQEDDTFEIPAKNASVERLRRWRIFNELNARKPDEVNIFTGVYTGIIGLAIILQILIVEFQFVGNFAKTVELDFKL